LFLAASRALRTRLDGLQDAGFVLGKGGRVLPGRDVPGYVRLLTRHLPSVLTLDYSLVIAPAVGVRHTVRSRDRGPAFRADFSTEISRVLDS